KYGKSVDALAKHLNSAANSVEDLGRRTRVMVRKLSDVEKIPDGDSAKLLGLQDAAIADVEEEDEAGDPI
ncbi:MAG TPA: DNA recombination protein RmuC, partial [Stellaceae bacterium]|nr:DNA recombination protein RmuC [Stellaceae bacterium]